MAYQAMFHNCYPSVKDGINEYWSRKTNRIERLLHRMPPDQRHLRLGVKHRKNVYDVRAVLQMPTGTLAAEGSDPDWGAAVDTVADRLTEEIRRHKDQIRRENGYRRSRQRVFEESPSETETEAELDSILLDG